MSSAVTESTSAAVVTPQATLYAPCSMSVTIPRSTAARLMVVASTDLRMSGRTSSSTIMSS